MNGDREDEGTLWLKFALAVIITIQTTNLAFLVALNSRVNELAEKVATIGERVRTR